jgi:hypothetical protein
MIHLIHHPGFNQRNWPHEFPERLTPYNPDEAEAIRHISQKILRTVLQHGVPFTAASSPSTHELYGDMLADQRAQIFGDDIEISPDMVLGRVLELDTAEDDTGLKSWAHIFGEIGLRAVSTSEEEEVSSNNILILGDVLFRQDANELDKSERTHDLDITFRLHSTGLINLMTTVNVNGQSEVPSLAIWNELRLHEITPLKSHAQLTMFQEPAGLAQAEAVAAYIEARL